MLSAAAVGNEFLQLGWNNPSVPDVTQMKLQKLLFYAHAWHLALNDAPLFKEDFEAWSWGPVVRDVYSQTAKFGRLPISTELVRVQETDAGFGFAAPKIDDPETKTFIARVWDSHKRFTGIQLSNSTHAPGEPWTIVNDNCRSLEMKPTIPNDLIQKVFKAKLSKALSAPA